MLITNRIVTPLAKLKEELLAISRAIVERCRGEIIVHNLDELTLSPSPASHTSLRAVRIIFASASFRASSRVVTPGTMENKASMPRSKDALQQQIIKLPNRVDYISPIVQAVTLFQFFVHKGEVNPFIYLT